MITTKRLMSFAVAGGLIALTTFATGAEKKGANGAALFQQHCAMCHPDGGNIINAAKTLHKKSRDANGVKTAKDIVGKMRNPGPSMTKFDSKAISNKDAAAIADHIIKTFK